MPSTSGSLRIRSVWHPPNRASPKQITECCTSCALQVVVLAGRLAGLAALTALHGLQGNVLPKDA
jgi:hypothetical protein